MTKEVNHKKRSHAILPPSAAHRWAVCTPSARIEEQLPDTTSEAAAEGTVAHEMCEVKLRGYYYTPEMTPKKKTAALTKIRKKELYKPEMEGYTDTYLDVIKEITTGMDNTPVVKIEEKVDLTEWVPEGFGLIDCLIIGSDKLVVCDFKYGKGVKVDVTDNHQLMLYALGAYRAYNMIYDIQKIELVIIQPRIDHIDKCMVMPAYLLNWGEDIRKRAQMAWAGEGKFNPGEKQCRFCKAKATCKARADYNVRLAFSDPVNPKTDKPAISLAAALIPNDRIGEYLKLGMDVAAWVDDLKAHALSESLAGRPVAGWKAVEGRQLRTWSDQEQAFEALKAGGVPEAMLWERKPLTLAKVEETVGKKQFNDIAGKFVVKQPGKPTLVIESDKRPAITNTITAKEAFADEKGGSENG